MQSELVAKLRGLCIDWTGEPIIDGSTPRIEPDCATLREAAAAIERLVAERDEAREALRPFANLANDYMTDTVNIEDDVIIAGRMPRRGEEGVPPRVTFGDFRRAHLVDKIGRARQALGDT